MPTKTSRLAVLAIAVFAFAALPANAATIFFANDAAGFAAAMAGNTSLGTEDFEGSILGPGTVVGVDDPLTQGIANGPYPAGLSLPLAVQSNLLGGAAATTSPRGAAGLAAASAGSNGATSDVVVANFFVDSLDLIFAPGDQISGVGLNTIALGGAGSVNIQVYDTLNNLLGSTTIAGDAAGTNFLGIQTTGGDLIGRINIFSTSSAAEGADNVQLFTANVPEPGTLALVIAGLLGRAAVRRRKANR